MTEDDIIWSLERCCCGVPDACSDCNYDNYPPRICVQRLTADALELIKNITNISCKNCKNLNKYENEIELGYNSPCTTCKRRMQDNYEEEINK